MRAPGSISICAFEPRTPVRCRLVGAVALAIERLRTLERGIEQRVAAAKRDRTELTVGADLEPLPPRAAEVAEVAKAGLLGHHEQNVVAIVGAEVAGIPAHAPRPRAVPLRSVACRDLIERRIAGHRVGQLAR